MILSDVDLLARLREGDLVVEPIDDLDRQVQPASIDLRLGERFLEFQRTNISCIHPNREQEVSDYVSETNVPEGEEFILHPGDFVLGTTKERVEVPPDLIAHVQGRSSLGRLAVVIHATAGVVDPGYRGQITLELSNLGTAPVALTPGMRVSQLIFTELRTPADRPYGVERGSKYQDQDGPQASRIGTDPEFERTRAARGGNDGNDATDGGTGTDAADGGTGTDAADRGDENDTADRGDPTPDRR